MSVTSPHTRWMSPPPVYDQANSYISTTTLKPYLQLPHLLSLTWLAYPILSLLFVAFRLQLSSSASQDAIANAKGDLLTSCKAAERAATAAASMPRYMAIATNQQFADAANGTMNAAREALVLSLTVMETIINFIVDIYRSTFLCFLELVVRGGLAIIIGAVQEINSFLQSTFSGIRTSIQNDVSSANSAIQSAVSGINKVNPFGNINVPQFNIPSLDALQNVTLPTDFEDALNKLNASLPTVSDLKDKVNALLDTPFEALKKDINDTFIGLSFDQSILPVPEQNTLAFCGDLDTSVVDDLGHDLLQAAKIGTIILVILVLVLLGANCALEWYKWRCQQRHLEYTRQAWLTDPTIYHTGASQSAPTITLTDHNLLMLQANGAHPLLTRIANTLSARLRLSASQHIHLQWFFHYIFHPPALACFLIGFFGLLSVQLQLIAIGPLEAKYQAQAASSISDFSNTIASSMNNSMYNQSAFYANDVNGHVDTIQNSINNGLFGWVNGTTTTLNNTLNEFYDDIQSAVSTVFNGTILESPVQEFVKCFIGSKVDAFEEALTFMNQNLNVHMPRVNDSILVLSPTEVNEATQPIAAAAIGGGNNDHQGLVGRLVNTYVESLKKERIMFAIFMGLWGIVVLMALGVIFWHSYGHRWVEARRKRRWQRDQRGGLDGVTIGAPIPRTSFDDSGLDRGNGNLSEKGGDTDSQVNLRSFTPLPEPKSGLSFNPFRRSTAPLAGSSLHPDEKRLDSFFDDGTNRTPTVAPLNISKPKKLMAIGRKAIGKERVVGDEENGTREMDGDGDDRQSFAWLKRMKGSLFNRNQPDYPPQKDDDANRQSLRSRLRPSLTISVGNAPGPKAEGATVQKSPRASPTAGLTSHWSVSPSQHHVAPWMNVVPPMPISSPPARPQPKRNANVPTDVLSTYDDSSLLIPKQPPPLKSTPFAVPLHHGFERPIPPGTPWSPTPSPFDSPIYQTPAPVTPSHPSDNLATPRELHRRSSSVPTTLFKYAGHRDGSTPGTRKLVTPRTRQSSNAVPINPFATPFDDDAHVTNDGKPFNNLVKVNPFEQAVAI